MKPLDLCDTCKRYAWDLYGLQTAKRHPSLRDLNVCFYCLEDIVRRSGGQLVITLEGQGTILLPGYLIEMP